MKKTEFLVGKVGLAFSDDFYPEDLPEDWRFDHYSTVFKALALPLDGDEDLDNIFETISKELGEDFELVLTIDEEALNNPQQLEQLLTNLRPNIGLFTLWCLLSHEPKPASIKILKDFRVCFQSSVDLNIKYHSSHILNHHLYYSTIPVLFLLDINEVEQLPTTLESFAQGGAKAVLIYDAKGDILNNMQVISAVMST